MKKIAMALLALISAILMCFGVAACDSLNLGGKNDSDNSSNSGNSGNSDNSGDSGNSGTNSSSVAGKVYVFDDLSVKFDSTVTAEEKAEINSSLDFMKAMYAGSEMAFTNDGECIASAGGGTSTLYYVQEKDSVYLYYDKEDIGGKTYAQEVKVGNNKITMTEEEGGVTLSVVYKYDRAYNSGNSGNGGNNEKPGDSGNSGTNNSSVAGKVYVFDDISIKFDSTVSAEDREQINKSLDYIKSVYMDTELIFTNDGEYIAPLGDNTSVLYYVQEGNTVYLYPSKALIGNKDYALIITVSDNRLLISNEEDGVTMTVSYKYDRAYTGGNSGNSGNGGNSGNTGNDKPSYPDNPGDTGNGGNSGNTGNDKPDYPNYPDNPGDKEDPSFPGGSESDIIEVAGLVFVFDDLTVSYNGNVPDNMKVPEEMIKQKIESYARYSVTFASDGRCIQNFDGDLDIGYYIQRGDSIYYYNNREDYDRGNFSDIIQVRGNKVVFEHDEGGIIIITLTLRYDRVASESDLGNSGNSGNTGNDKPNYPDKPDNPGKEEENPDIGVVELAGKIFMFAGIDITFDDGLTYDDVKDEIDLNWIQMTYNGSQVAFDYDNTYVAAMTSGYVEYGYYVQQGRYAYMFHDVQDYLNYNLSEANILIVEGYTFKMVNSMDGVTVSLIYAYDRVNDGSLGGNMGGNPGYPGPDYPDYPEPDHPGDWGDSDLSIVAGKSYLYAYSSFDYGPDVNKEDIDDMREWYEGVEIFFWQDGACIMVWYGEFAEQMYYIQEGNEVYVYENREVADRGDKSEAMLFTLYGEELVIVWDEHEKNIIMTAFFRLNRSGSSGSVGGGDHEYPGDKDDDWGHGEPNYPDNPGEGWDWGNGDYIYVGGRSYQFYGIDASLSGELAGQEWMLEGKIDAAAENLAGTRFIFNDDGTVVQVQGDRKELAYFVQEGNRVYVFNNLEDLYSGDIMLATQCVVSGEKLLITQSDGSITMTVIMTLI